MILIECDAPKTCASCEYSSYKYPHAYCRKARKQVDIDSATKGRDDFCPMKELITCGVCAYRNETNCPQYYRREELKDDYYCGSAERRAE